MEENEEFLSTPGSHLQEADRGSRGDRHPQPGQVQEDPGRPSGVRVIKLFLSFVTDEEAMQATVFVPGRPLTCTINILRL